MALAPTPPQQRPTMRHSSAFLLPPPSASPATDAATVALVVLNQPLPRFAPLLWSRGNSPAGGPSAPFQILLVSL